MKRKWVLEQYIPKVEKSKDVKSFHKKDVNEYFITENPLVKSSYKTTNGIKKVMK